MSLLLALIVSLVGFVLLCLLVVLLPALRYSVTIRTVEAACGLAAALVGCLGMAYAFFGPFFENSAYAPPLQIAEVPYVLVIVFILSLAPIGVAVSAVQHSRAADSGWRIVLWVVTMFLVILTFLTGFSIGLLLFPSTLLALLASAFSLGTSRAAPG